MHDDRGLKSRLRKVAHPRAAPAVFAEMATYEVRPNTFGTMIELAKLRRGRRIKPVAVALFEGEGRRAKRLYAALGHERFYRAWSTYPVGVRIDFERGEAFKDGEPCSITDVVLRSNDRTQLRIGPDGLLCEPAAINLLAPSNHST